MLCSGFVVFVCGSVCVDYVLASQLFTYSVRTYLLVVFLCLVWSLVWSRFSFVWFGLVGMDGLSFHLSGCLPRFDSAAAVVPGGNFAIFMHGGGVCEVGLSWDVFVFNVDGVFGDVDVALDVSVC